jgi:hypothetical protein
MVMIKNNKSRIEIADMRLIFWVASRSQFTKQSVKETDNPTTNMIDDIHFRQHT